MSPELAGRLPTAGPPVHSYAEVIDVNLIFFVCLFWSLDLGLEFQVLNIIS